MVAIIQQVTSWSISSSGEKNTYWRINCICTKPMDGTDLRLLLIICKVTVKWKTNKACFLIFKHENDIKKHSKHTPEIPSSFVLSFTIHSSQSQSRDTIPLTQVNSSYMKWMFVMQIHWFLFSIQRGRNSRIFEMQQTKSYSHKLFRYR